MNKAAILFFLSALSLAGCKSVKPVNGFQPQEPIPMKTFEPPSPVANPAEWVATVVRKASFADSVPPIDQPKMGTPKRKTDEKHRLFPLVAKVKPAPAPKMEVGEKVTAAPQLDTPSLSTIPKDVWYAIATIFGAVFTSLLAPIAVEIIRERRSMGRSGKHQVGEVENLTIHN